MRKIQLSFREIRTLLKYKDCLTTAMLFVLIACLVFGLLYLLASAIMLIPTGFDYLIEYFKTGYIKELIQPIVITSLIPLLMVSFIIIVILYFVIMKPAILLTKLVTIIIQKKYLKQVKTPPE